jgi:putative flavoprotein involved in K+ transport
MGDYLEAYAAKFELPVRTGTRVERLFQRDGAFVVTTNRGEIEADQVVVAMANYQNRRVPDFARALRSDIVQMHSCDYRNPAQLRDGGVLIVGAGNSGAEIAKELSGRHEVWMSSGRPTGEAPIRMDSLASRLILARVLMRLVFHRLLTVKTPLGRKVRPKILHHAAPLIRVRGKDLAALGVKRVGRVTGVRDGRPVLEDGKDGKDGQAADIANVIWCTGFHPGFSWIDLPVFDAGGEADHDAGVVTAAPGLYFVGLHFLYAMSSAMIHGVGRDAKRIVATLAARAPSLRPQAQAYVLSVAR